MIKTRYHNNAIEDDQQYKVNSAISVAQRHVHKRSPAQAQRYCQHCMASKLEPKPHAAVLAKTHTYCYVSTSSQHSANTQTDARPTPSVTPTSTMHRRKPTPSSTRMLTVMDKRSVQSVKNNQPVHAPHSAGGNGGSRSGMEDAVLISSARRPLSSS